MSAMPRISPDGTSAILFALIIALDKRGILPQSEFIADLGEVVEMSKTAPFVAPSVVSEMAAIHQWLSERQKPRH